jgi:hypothetical protein
MQRLATLCIAVAALAGGVSCMAQASAGSEGEAAPIFGVKLPVGYRDWRLIAVGREHEPRDDIRAILGNDIALEAARKGQLPMPDGAIIARVAWTYSPLDFDVFGPGKSFVAGAPKNGVQFMLKDSKKYASTGGWGFAQFDDGKPASEALHEACFACHEAAQARDRVFNRYAP